MGDDPLLPPAYQSLTVRQRDALMALALVDTPASNREVHTALGKDVNIEHSTGRALRALAESGYVERDTSTKPYANELTDDGRDLLEAAGVV
jgi:predicted transcriptional regulator